MAKSVHTDDYKVFLTLLRETRTASGVTQEELAKKLGQTQSFVSKLERGEIRLDVIQLRTICQHLGTSLTAFVSSLEDRLRKKRR